MIISLTSGLLLSPHCAVSGRLPEAEEAGVVLRPPGELTQRLHRRHALLRQPGVLSHVGLGILYKS